MNEIIRGKWLIARENGRPRVIKKGAIYVEDGIIRDIGDYGQISKTYHCDVELGSEAHVVMPGLVNAHHHGNCLSKIQVGIKDCPLEMWLPNVRILLRNLGVDIYYNTLLSCIRMMESGVTSSIHLFDGRDPRDTVAYEKDLEKALKAHVDSGMRIAFAPGINDQNQFAYAEEDAFVSRLPQDLRDKFFIKPLKPDEISDRIDSYLKTFDRLRDKYKGYVDRVRFLLAPSGVQWCSNDLLNKIKKKAHSSKVGIHMHLLETTYQRDYGPRVYGKSQVQHLKDLAFLGSEVSCAHGIWVSDNDVETLASTGTTVVHNPSSNLRIFDGMAPVQSMMEKGVNVALGIDNNSLNDDEDMFQEMRLCSVIHRKPSMTNYERYSETLSPPNIIDMATIRGAYATGFGKDIGRIEIGARADVVLVNTKNFWYSQYSGVPIEDILIGCAKGSDVDTVIIDGEVVMENRKFVKLDKEQIVHEVKQSLKEIAPETLKKIDEYKSYIKAFYEGWDEKAPISLK